MSARVIVIGAGISGLAAAYRLAQHGVNVLVLEKEDYVGGRIKSGFDHDFGLHWEAGAQFIGGMYRNTGTLLKELGLSNNRQPIKACVDVIGSAGQFPLCRHSPARPRPHLAALPWREKLALLRLVWFLLSSKNKINVSDLSEGEILDDISFGQWVENLVGPEMNRLYLEPVTRSLFFQATREISRLIPLTLLRNPLQRHIHSMAGGIGEIAISLARHVQAVKNALVTRIEVDEPHRKAWITFIQQGKKEKTLSADRVVLAIPAPEILNVFDCPAQIIGEQGHRFLQQTGYVSAAVTTLVTSPPVGNDLYGYVFEPGDHGLTSISFGSAGKLARCSHGITTIISAGYKPGASDDRIPVSNLMRVSGPVPASELLPASDLVSAAEQYLPGLSDKTVRRYDYLWPYAIPCFPPGRVKESVAFRNSLKAGGLLSFCGDYLDGPGIEGAISSGLRAAGEIINSIR